MRARDLVQLAMMGVAAGLMVSACGTQQTQEGSSSQVSATEQMSSDIEAFYDVLEPEAQKKFLVLDAQHKMMAIEMANQSCTGQNKCQGMGGCGTADHSCAGENDCKGQGGKKLQDPNQAVGIQYTHQMKQREQVSEGLDEREKHAAVPEQSTQPTETQEAGK